MKIQQIRNSMILLLTAVIWGTAFVAQSVGMDYVGPFTFNCVRTLIGGVVLIPCIALLNRLERGTKRRKGPFPRRSEGGSAGICLWEGSFAA